MGKIAQFNFVAEDLIAKKPKYNNVEYKVSLMRSVAKVKATDGTEKDQINYNIYFPREVVFIYDLTGKTIKFYIDDSGKKSIAWRILDGETTTLEQLDSGRKITPLKSGAWVTSVTKLVNHAKIKIEETRSKIPVKKYITTEFGVSKTYYYIEI